MKKKVRILIVEGEEILAEYYRTYFKGNDNLDIVVATNMLSAEAEIMRENPLAILMGTRIPAISGEEIPPDMTTDALIRKIKKEHPYIQLWGASAVHDFYRRLKNAGCSMVFSKKADAIKELNKKFGH